MCASLIVALAMKESPHNLKNPVWTHADGSKDPLTMGVPKSWEIFNKCSNDGTFSVDYTCSPEDRNFAYRTKLMQEYGFWKYEVVLKPLEKADKEVMWWAAMGEAPDDVREFLEWLVSRYDDIFKAFRDIDGPGGNGVVSYTEFRDGLKKMKCNKFEGKNEEKRIKDIFGYLDPGGEGSVSEGEWSVLEALYKEMQLSISEFVQFLERTYGQEEGADYLEIAWGVLDDDGSGAITCEEWIETVKKGLKYFGPAQIIFGFLDKDDEGDVSLDEFRVLYTYARSKPAVVKRDITASPEQGDGDWQNLFAPPLEEDEGKEEPA